MGSTNYFHVSFKRFRIFLLLCLLPATLGHAQKVRFGIQSTVVDVTTRKEMTGVHITVMTLDSTVVNEMTTYKKTVTYESLYGQKVTASAIQNTVDVPSAGEYLVRFAKAGYGTAYRRVSVTPPRRGSKKEKMIKQTGMVLLVPESIQLGEAKVTASKILMVMRGDTLVYNADALHLAAGSMLERLIQELPGVQIDDYGQITVFGQKVTSLLLNGKDFFSGDPLVALENLPAYMVDKIKVYQREAPDAYLYIQKDGEKEEPQSSGGWKEGNYVMDVNLKREYSTGWIANAEGAYGTNERYLARALALRFSDRSRTSLYFNLNNTNDTRRPGRSGNWASAWTASGLTAMKEGGIDFLLTDPTSRKLGELSTTLTARYEDADNRSETSRTQFLTSDDVFSRSRTASRLHKTAVNWNNKFELRAKRFYASLTPNVQFVRIDDNGRTQAADFRREPVETYRGQALDSLFAPAGSRALDSIVINRREDAYLGRQEEWMVTGKGYISLPYWFVFEPKDLSVWGTYRKNDRERFSRYDARYATGETDFRNRFETTPSMSYNFGTKLTAGTPLLDLGEMTYSLDFNYTYEQSYASDRRSLYRLDGIGGEWASPDATDLGQLPSSRDALAEAVDQANSYYTPQRSYAHTPKFSLYVSFPEGWGTLTADISGRYRHDWLKDRRGERQAERSRRFHSWEPNVSYHIGIVTFIYDFKRTAPALNNMLDVIDDSDPLNIWQGNPALRATGHHAMSLGMTKGRNDSQHNDRWAVTAKYDLFRHSIGLERTYDMGTGITRVQPKNIDGNWNAQLSGTYYSTPDRKQRFWFETRTDASFAHSVDFASAYGSGVSGRSSVDNFSLRQSLSGRYLHKGLNLSAKASADWNYATSERLGFSTINAVDFQYGVGATVPLPWDMEVGTDLTMYSRRGYADPSMNTDDLVWNMRISKSMLPRRNLTVFVDGFDILGQLSNIRRVINAQGRTETWYNTVPRYFMVHLIYRLNREPKKKTE